MMMVATHNHRICTLYGRSHDIGVAGELASAQMNGLMYGTAFEEVVALVGTAAGIEEREQSRDKQRRFVVRDRKRSCKYGHSLTVFAMRAREKERIFGSESVGYNPVRL